MSGDEQTIHAIRVTYGGSGWRATCDVLHSSDWMRLRELCSGFNRRENPFNASFEVVEITVSSRPTEEQVADFLKEWKISSGT